MKHDSWWIFLIESEIGIFRDYLNVTEEFLQIEKRKHLNSIHEITEGMISGSIISQSDPDEFPVELVYDYVYIEQLDNFAQILRKSFFISLYTFLETRLEQTCHDLQQRHRLSLSLTDIAGRGIDRAMSYLTKVAHVPFQCDQSPEWNEIQHYRRLRNCIVHNEGFLDESVAQRKQLEVYIRQKSNLMLSTANRTEIIIDKGFCAEAIETITKFFYALDVSIKARDRT